MDFLYHDRGYLVYLAAKTGRGREKFSSVQSVENDKEGEANGAGDTGGQRCLGMI